jgi:hypothetical protein
LAPRRIRRRGLSDARFAGHCCVRTTGTPQTSPADKTSVARPPALCQNRFNFSNREVKLNRLAREIKN